MKKQLFFINEVIIDPFMSHANQEQNSQNPTDTTPDSLWYKVQFRTGEQIFTATTTIKELHPHDEIMVITDHGLEPARLIGNGLPAPTEEPLKDLKPAFTIQSRCNKDDQEKYTRLLEREQEAAKACRDLIQQHKLKMKLIRVERFYNGSKIIFYFTAENRVDFRALVKDLVQEFRTRVEIRQVRVRQETKMIGGIGSCGRELCCSSYLDNFAPVSIKMAKEQSLPLNPTKISGICNRLLCCITYEFPMYREIRRAMPRCGKNITIDNKPLRVIKQNILEESVTVIDPNDRDVIMDIPK
ncbi:MAG: regulatory iron-sulfur-containing complex subunit RicT, partial [Spirochaetales bacterium]|nr:regulatory iron-sulfur-containing complex subunit RicT [Spirochaetales bacterium]